MTTKAFRGLFPPLLTPFDQQGGVNESELRKHVDAVIANRVDGSCAGSSTGEFMDLTQGEGEQVMQVCQEQDARRVPMTADTRNAE